MTDPDPEGRIPLHYAAIANDVDITRARLAAGDDPDFADNLGFTPLHLAAQQGSLAAAQVLIEHGADIDRRNSFGNTPLFVAVFNSRGRGDLILLLREQGANPFLVNNSGQTPVALARLIGNYDVAQFFADLPM
jgi:ankyrin repeat protein